MLQLLLMGVFKTAAAILSENCSSFDSCQDCANHSPCRWCLSSSSCVFSMYSCHPRSTVEDAYNCPMAVLPSYNDSFVKYELLYLIAAANAVNNSRTGNERAAYQCVGQMQGDIQLVNTIETDCFYGRDRCALLIALHHDWKMIVVAFRTTSSFISIQFLNQGAHFILRKMISIPNTPAFVNAYYSETYWDLFQAGLNDRLVDYTTKYPNYNFMLLGHSFGGAAANIAAFHVKRLFPDRGINLYTFAAPRVGDVQFVTLIEEFQAANIFRIVRNRDWVPDFPFRNSLVSRMTHSRYEAFYADMDLSTPAKLCHQAEDSSCSLGTWIKNPWAHTRLWHNVHTWYEEGCTTL